MSVRLTRYAATVVVAVSGEFDLRTGHQPHEAVAPLLEPPSTVELVVVDLSGVDFIDSTGLGGLIRLKQDTDAHGVPLRLRGLDHRLRSLFAITGLDQEFALETGPPTAAP